MRRLRFTELGGLVAGLLVAAMGPGCGAATGLDAGERRDGSDREDAGADASEPTCTDPDGYLVQHYVFDGEPGSTGCVQAGSSSLTRRDSVNRNAPALEMHFGYRDEPGRDPAETRGLPRPLCGAALVFENTTVDSGASGELVDLETLPDSGYVARVGVLVGYDTTPEDGACNPGNDRAAVRPGGTWRVLTGGTFGDIVEVEARDVHVEDAGGHTVTFERMYWRVRLGGPIEYP